MIAPHAMPAMPYPGLRPFEAEDAALFFGREIQVNALLRQLEDHRFVAVVGSSGSGKSSLVRAGLLPAVREGFLLGSTDWRILLMRPGQSPYQALAQVLNEDQRARDPAIASATQVASNREANLLASLRSSDLGLLKVLSDTPIGSHGKVMLVVDQFEELFAYRRSGARREDVISRDEAAGFVKLLLRSCA
ncbi:MAG: AAA family ATPase, partial [Methylococcales bacterium]